MGYIHPTLATLTFCLALYVLFLGMVRFKTLHLKKPARFPWKKHVQYGSIVLAFWFFLPFGGLTGAYILWGNTFISGQHAHWGLAMLPLVLFGYISGKQLDKNKQKYKTLPLLHGLCNAILVGLTLSQAITGRALVQLL